MTKTAPNAAGELPFRTWTAIAPAIVAARRDWPTVRRLLEPHRDALVYGWREDAREDELRLGHVFLCAGEATAHLALIAAPSRQFRDFHTPAIKPRLTKAAVRLDDHLGDDKFLDDLCTRLASVTPFDPSTMPDAPDWLWVIQGYERYNLLADDERIVFPARWSGERPRLGLTRHVRIFDSHGRMGLMTRAGVITAPCRYAYLGDPDSRTGAACEASLDRVPNGLGPCDLIDTTGRRLNPPGIKVLAGSLSFGIGVAVREEDGAEGLKGFIAADGRLLGDIRWSRVARHHSGLALVKESATGLWGFVDQHGAIQIEPQFTSAAGFTNDRAAVSLPDSDGLFGLIDPSGKLVAPAVWRDIHCFNGNLFHVTDTDGAIGLVDEIGGIVIQPRHPTAEDQELIEDSHNFIRGHPFSLQRGKQLRERIEAALAGSETLAPIEGMLMPNAISDTELEAAGLLGVRVQVVADHLGKSRRIPLRGGDIGHIGWHYPVTGSIFDLAVEAPVTGLSTLPHGALGVPWRLLRRLGSTD